MIRRKIKTIAHKYTPVQVKVREATTNDPWGPSGTLMATIADYTHKESTFQEVMTMIWIRLNAKAKNWRHIYKGLLLLEYIIKTGHERVAEECRLYLQTIQTLNEFKHEEDGKDLGLCIREKSKSLMNLLKDDDLLKVERTRAIKARQRMGNTTTSESTKEEEEQEQVAGSSSLSSALPKDAGEEALQLEVALALSKEEHDEEERRRGPDRTEALIDTTTPTNDPWSATGTTPTFTMAASDPWTAAPGNSQSVALNNDPWTVTTIAGADKTKNVGGVVDPWGTPTAVTGSRVVASDPWGPVPFVKEDDVVSRSPFDLLTSQQSGAKGLSDAWSTEAVCSSIQGGSRPQSADLWSISGGGVCSTAESVAPRPTTCSSDDGLDRSGKKGTSSNTFLGRNAALVDLDDLMPKTRVASNPFLGHTSHPNPFLQQEVNKVPLSQLIAQKQTPFNTNNPFL